MKDKVNDKKNVEDGFAYCAEHFGVSVDEVKEDIKDLFDFLKMQKQETVSIAYLVKAAKIKLRKTW